MQIADAGKWSYVVESGLSRRTARKKQWLSLEPGHATLTDMLCPICQNNLTKVENELKHVEITKTDTQSPTKVEKRHSIPKFQIAFGFGNETVADSISSRISPIRLHKILHKSEHAIAAGWQIAVRTVAFQISKACFSKSKENMTEGKKVNLVKYSIQLNKLTVALQLDEFTTFNSYSYTVLIDRVRKDVELNKPLRVRIFDGAHVRIPLICSCFEEWMWCAIIYSALSHNIYTDEVCRENMSYQDLLNTNDYLQRI